MARGVAAGLPAPALLLAAAVVLPAAVAWAAGAAAAAAPACRGDAAGLTLPPGFCATIFADGIGHARHLAVAPDGTVYVNTWSGRYYGNDAPADGGMLVALRDTGGTGHADIVRRFGAGPPQGARGGTGIALYQGYLYAEEGDRIERYRLPAGNVVPQGPPEVVVSGMPLGGDHPMHPFVIGADGAMYVDMGSATNACQAQNRLPHVPGQQPCTELETRGGIWRFDANRTGQRFAASARYATGLRNAEGMAFDSGGRLFATQHGRDQLRQDWPELYTQAQGAALPAEELVQLRPGADYGWPACYYDGDRHALVLAPEYGGDGARIGLCADKQAPVASFPGHWAPDDLAIYDATQFPPAYRGGAFIAFHGSWNRAPLPQGGYNVVFQKLVDGHASGTWTVFADGFAGAIKEPGRAAHRPAGLAVAPDGAMFIADDEHGRIYRVTYRGDTQAAQAAPASVAAGRAAAVSGR